MTPLLKQILEDFDGAMQQFQESTRNDLSLFILSIAGLLLAENIDKVKLNALLRFFRFKVYEAYFDIWGTAAKAQADILETKLTSSVNDLATVRANQQSKLASDGLTKTLKAKIMKLDEPEEELELDAYTSLVTAALVGDASRKGFVDSAFILSKSNRKQVFRWGVSAYPRTHHDDTMGRTYRSNELIEVGDYKVLDFTQLPTSETIQCKHIVVAVD